MRLHVTRQAVTGAIVAGFAMTALAACSDDPASTADPARPPVVENVEGEAPDNSATADSVDQYTGLLGDRLDNYYFETQEYPAELSSDLLSELDMPDVPFTVSVWEPADQGPGFRLCVVDQDADEFFAYENGTGVRVGGSGNECSFDPDDVKDTAPASEGDEGPVLPTTADYEKAEALVEKLVQDIVDATIEKSNAAEKWVGYDPGHLANGLPDGVKMIAWFVADKSGFNLCMVTDQNAAIRGRYGAIEDANRDCVAEALKDAQGEDEKDGRR